MASVPIPTGPDAPTAETPEERFRRLEALWERETAYHSNPELVTQHPAFQEIVRMGDAAVPSILRRLEERPRVLVWALPLITGEDPVPRKDAGKIAKMCETWVRWGRERGYQW